MNTENSVWQFHPGVLKRGKTYKQVAYFLRSEFEYIQLSIQVLFLICK